MSKFALLVLTLSVGLISASPFIFLDVTDSENMEMLYAEDGLMTEPSHYRFLFNQTASMTFDLEIEQDVDKAALLQISFPDSSAVLVASQICILFLEDYDGAILMDTALLGPQSGTIDYFLDITTDINITGLKLTIEGTTSDVEGYFDMSAGVRVFPLNDRTEDGVFLANIVDGSDYVISKTTDVSSNNPPPEFPLSVRGSESDHYPQNLWWSISTSGGNLTMNLTEPLSMYQNPVLTFRFGGSYQGVTFLMEAFNTTDGTYFTLGSNTVIGTGATWGLSLMSFYLDSEDFKTSGGFPSYILRLRTPAIHTSMWQYVEITEGEDMNNDYASRTLFDATNTAGIDAGAFLSTDPAGESACGTEGWTDYQTNVPLLAFCTDSNVTGATLQMPADVANFATAHVEFSFIPLSTNGNTNPTIFHVGVADDAAGTNKMRKATFTHKGVSTFALYAMTRRVFLGTIDMDMYPYLYITMEAPVEGGDPWDVIFASQVTFYNVLQDTASSTMTPSTTPSSSMTTSMSATMSSTMSQTASSSAAVTPSQTPTLSPSGTASLAADGNSATPSASPPADRKVAVELRITIEGTVILEDVIADIRNATIAAFAEIYGVPAENIEIIGVTPVTTKQTSFNVETRITETESVTAEDIVQTANTATDASVLARLNDNLPTNLTVTALTVQEAAIVDTSASNSVPFLFALVGAFVASWLF